MPFCLHIFIASLGD